MKRLLGSLLTWSVTIAIMMLFLMKGFYPAMMESRESVEKIFANFPPELLVAFGMDVTRMFSYEGFLSFSNIYISLLSAMMAVSIALQVFAREKRDKCTDFLFTRPMTRAEVFWAKFMAGISNLAVFGVIYGAVVIYDFNAQNLTPLYENSLVYYILSPFLTMLVFFTLATLYAVFSKRVRTIAGTATAFAFGAFVLSGLVDLLEKDFLRYIAPLDYFNTGYVLEHGNFEPSLMITALVLFVFGNGLVYWRYKTHDVQAV
jgi:ABC-2 type transport system permease protein